MSNTILAKQQQIDPADFFSALQGMSIVKPVTYTSATQTLGTVPANSIITGVQVVRTTAWDAAPTTFEIGKSGDSDWLVTTIQANVNGAITAGEDGEAEAITSQKVVTSDTAIVLTLNQGAAAAGAGYVVVNFVELDR